MALGQDLKMAMEARGLNARQLAERIAYQDYRQVYRWVHGDFVPSTPVLQRLVEVLGLDPRATYLAAHPEARWFFEPRPVCGWCGAPVTLDADGRWSAHPFPEDSGLDGQCDGSGMSATEMDAELTALGDG